MGWAINQACGQKQCQSANITNYLEFIVSSSNTQANAQIQQFIQYLEQNSKGINKGVRNANIDNIRIRYYDKTGKINEIYKGNDLNEDKYGNIMAQINQE